jgi:hypothetical protein
MKLEFTWPSGFNSVRLPALASGSAPRKLPALPENDSSEIVPRPASKRKRCASGRSGAPVNSRSPAIAAAAKRTLANVKSSAMIPRHPDVPNLIWVGILTMPFSTLGFP